MSRQLLRLAEPRLLFRHDQAMEDPRDGLTLFGPMSKGAPYGIRYGVIGTRSGIPAFNRWVKWIQHPVRPQKPRPSRPPFPGFESVFRIPWSGNPVQTIEIDEDELHASLFLDDRNQRVFHTVGLFAKAIKNNITEEEVKPDIWFVVIPDIVRKYCRPEANVEPDVRLAARRQFATVALAKSRYRQPSLIDEENEAAEPYFYKEHFRNQFKARVLDLRVATQVVRESTICNVGPRGTTRSQKMEELLQSQIAWNISTTAFYKTGGRPWKVAGIREGVCYLGLVFKRDDRAGDKRWAACGAQMFLDSGDGVVFKGTEGNWFDEEREEFHLDEEAAFSLVTKALDSYRRSHHKPPAELFIHGQARFYRQEWRGFCRAAANETNVVTVKIRDDKGIKLFRQTDDAVLRGIAYVRDARNAFLWTRGWVPRLSTYPGMEVPNPLSIEICHGDAPIEAVLADILALTKLNYNTCRYGDGKPITLKFADAVGEVLTAGPVPDGTPLPFMYYI